MNLLRSFSFGGTGEGRGGIAYLEGGKLMFPAGVHLATYRPVTEDVSVQPYIAHSASQRPLGSAGASRSGVSAVSTRQRTQDGRGHARQHRQAKAAKGAVPPAY